MVRKLKSRKGETLVEMLISILIGVLSVSLLFFSVAGSSRLSGNAAKSDKDYYSRLSAAETRTGTPVTSGKAHIRGDVSTDFDILIYGGQGAWSFAAKEEVGP